MNLRSGKERGAEFPSFLTRVLDWTVDRVNIMK